MPSLGLASRKALCLAWVGFIFLCMYYGRALAPWFEGARGAYALAFLAAWGLGFMAWVLWRLARLSPPERAGRGIGALLCLGGLGLLAWWQPLLIERSHLLLYGVLGVLAWRAAGGERGGAGRFLVAAAFCVAVGLADEVAQHFHPQRMFDTRDVITNGASAVLAMSALSLLRKKE